MRTKTFIPQAILKIPVLRIAAYINLLVIILFMTGCKEAPVTEQDARQLRAAIDSAVIKNDASVLSNLIDADELADRVAEQMPKKPDFATRRGIRKGASGVMIGSQIMQEIRKGASYRFVRAYADKGVQHLIYRLYGNEGLNYHDWELTRKGGAIKAADLMIYFTGETLSQSLAGLLSGIDKDDVRPELAAEMKEVRRLMNEGENDRAQAILDAWPDRIRNMRLMQLLNIQLQAARGQNKEYVAALERFAREFPDARNAPLLMIDAYFLTANYPKAMDAVNRLDDFVKGDPFLVFYRGLISKMSGDSTAYYDYTEKAYEASKDMEDVVLEKMYVSHQRGDAAGEREAEQVYRANPRFSPERLSLVKGMMNAGTAR